MELRAFPLGPFFRQMLEDLFLPIMSVKKKIVAGCRQNNFPSACVSL